MSDPLAPLVALEGVPSQFTGVRDGIDVMLRDRGLRRTRPEQTAESLLRGAHASAVLDGARCSLEEVRAGVDDQVVIDAVRLSSQLLSQAPVLGHAPMQVFARLDVLAGGNGTPMSTEGAARLQQLGRTLVATSVPALVVAAVVHAELATAVPFGPRSGLVARAAERLVLVARGVDPASLVVPEAGHLALRAEYESNLRGYATGGRNGVHAWLLYAAQAFARGTEASPLTDPAG